MHLAHIVQSMRESAVVMKCILNSPQEPIVKLWCTHIIDFLAVNVVSVLAKCAAHVRRTSPPSRPTVWRV